MKLMNKTKSEVQWSVQWFQHTFLYDVVEKVVPVVCGDQWSLEIFGTKQKLVLIKTEGGQKK